ncbi:hypothetical protein LshimejAT787_0303030 [Lyophyllum shimeji]|uniref:Uncharacterized protein n=1 Tax=Lyophyllum shimeji TaxID=47721 RepID=A0A9P3PH84_LYOSH|nr:hypothetical protein LshimejAT787_0303030 [Lyophyllum shimeji]
MSWSSGSSTGARFARPEHFTQNGSLEEWFCNLCTPPSSKHVDYMTQRAAQNHERCSSEHRQNVAEAERRTWANSPPGPEAWTIPVKHDPPLTAEEVKLRESRRRVDLVQDLVPFWIRGVEAAEKGEVLRLEQFLETLQDVSDSWLGRGPGTEDSTPWWGKAWTARGNDVADDERAAVNDDGWDIGDGLARRKETSGQKRKHQALRTTQQNGGGSPSPARGHRRNTNRGQRNHSNLNAYEFVEDVARQEAADEERKRRMHHFFDMPTDEKMRWMSFERKYVMHRPSKNWTGHDATPPALPLIVNWDLNV